MTHGTRIRWGSLVFATLLGPSIGLAQIREIIDASGDGAGHVFDRSR